MGSKTVCVGELVGTIAGFTSNDPEVSILIGALASCFCMVLCASPVTEVGAKVVQRRCALVLLMCLLAVFLSRLSDYTVVRTIQTTI